MKFNSFLESLRGIKISHQENYTFSTEALSIEQLFQPINNEIREKFYDYAKHNDFIEKFKGIIKGEISNFTEIKPVTHFKYKSSSLSMILISVMLVGSGELLGFSQSGKHIRCNSTV